MYVFSSNAKPLAALTTAATKCKSLIAAVILILVLADVAANADAGKEAYERGRACLERQDNDSAIRDFSEAIRLTQSLPRRMPRAGCAYGCKRQYDKAIDDLTNAIRLDPKNASAYYNRGLTYAQMSEYGRAISDLTDAIRLDPKDATVYYNRGRAYEETGDRDKSIADYTEAIRLNPKGEWAYANRGNSYFISGEYDKAIADYTTAIHLNPKDADPFQGRAGAYQKNGEYEKAIADLTEAIHLNPKNADLYKWRAGAYEHKSDYEKAIDDYSSAIRINPKDSTAFCNRCWAYKARGDSDKALADLDATQRLNPRPFFYYEARAAIRIGRGDYEGGIADLLAAIRLDPNDPAARFVPVSKEPLTAAALNHGERQVHQMLKDRPAMAQFGENAGALYQWAVRKFSGDDLQQTVFWDAAEPFFFDGENHPPTAAGPGYIRVSRTYRDGPNKGKERSFDSIWSTVVFELYNIANAKDFERLNREVAAGKLTKETFVSKMAECESGADEKTRAFYIHVFLPWAREHRVPTDPRSWYIASRADCRESIALSTADKLGTYWRYYERDFDSIMLDSLVNKGENEEAIQFGWEGADAHNGKLGKGHYLYVHGRAYANKGDIEKAMGSFNEAIRLDPTYAFAYFNRGWGCQRKFEYERAIADYDMAVRLNPTGACVYYYRGTVREILGDRAKAVADYSTAIKLDSKLAVAYLARGDVYYDLGNFDHAVLDYSVAISLAPTDAHAFHKRGLAYKKISRDEQGGRRLCGGAETPAFRQCRRLQGNAREEKDTLKEPGSPTTATSPSRFSGG